MGLLSLGTPLPWEKIEKHIDYVREHGIRQLLESIRQHGKREDDPMLWGDELEYMVVRLDPTSKKATLSLRQEQILDTLIAVDESSRHNVSYHQEYGRYMVEATPGGPYGPSITDLLSAESNMETRRQVAKQHMQDQEWLMSVSSFPRLGAGKFAEPWETPGGPAARSLFLPDSIINTHVRFPTLTGNIRTRRGEKVAINVPLLHDKNTPWPFHDPVVPWDRDQWPEDANARNGAAKDNHIYMDAMGFGMGCCCVQLTMQAASMAQARTLYDQLTPLCPLLMAVTAAAPLYRGYVSDQDTRFNVISGAVDDRYNEERTRIPKSRYDSVSTYIDSGSPELTAKQSVYNDIPLPQNPKVKEQLRGSGIVDELLQQHFAHLFIRDPLVVFEELLVQDDTSSMDHFENIQSTNWQTMRFKPPPLNQSNMGWRVEFRPMDVQVTDFENAAVCVFVVLVARAIVEHGLVFYMPLSQVDENMRIAHHRGAVTRETFWWRTNEGTFRKASLAEIFSGSKDITGLLQHIRHYLSNCNETVPVDVRREIDRYLDLLERRASGELDTAATWVRKFVDQHPDYQHDSVVNDSVQYDLLVALEGLMAGRNWDTLGQSMLGGCHPRTPGPKGNA